GGNIADYYQVITYDSRGWDFDGAWFARGTQNSGFLEFSVSASIQRLGFAPLHPGVGAAGYLVDLLPRLTVHLTTDPGGLEREPGKWKLAGFSICNSQPFDDC